MDSPVEHLTLVRSTIGGRPDDTIKSGFNIFSESLEEDLEIWSLEDLIECAEREGKLVELVATMDDVTVPYSDNVRGRNSMLIGKVTILRVDGTLVWCEQCASPIMCLYIEDTVEHNTVNWFAEAVPHPTEKNLSVQVGVHLEEVVEFLEELIVTRDNDIDAVDNLVDATKCLHELAELYKKNHEPVVFRDRVAAIDGLLDQRVTAIGTLHCLRAPVAELIKEVDHSNWSKFVDGKAVFDENGKIKKGGDYHKPDLVRVIDAFPVK